MLKTIVPMCKRISIFLIFARKLSRFTVKEKIVNPHSLDIWWKGEITSKMFDILIRTNRLENILENTWKLLAKFNLRVEDIVFPITITELFLGGRKL